MPPVWNWLGLALIALPWLLIYFWVRAVLGV